MKRIISLFCAALVCVVSLAAPVRADELSNDMLIDVLDFNTDKIDVQTFTPENPTVTFTLPETIPIRYVDCLVIVGGTTPTSFSCNGEVMTMEYIGSKMYRLYAKPEGSYNYVSITCDTSGSSRVTFEQVKIASRAWTHYDIESYCDIASVDYNSTIHYVPTDSTNSRNFDATDVAYMEAMFTATFYVTDWQKYDYLDFIASFEVLGINSVTAYFGDTVLEVEYNDWDNGQLMQLYNISARINLTGLDRLADYTPKVVVTGTWYAGWVNRIEVLGTTGYVILNDYNFLYYFLGNIKSTLTTGFNNVVSAIRGDTTSGENFQDDVQEELDELDQAQVVMDSVTKPVIDDIDVSVDQYVSQADIQVLAQPLTVIFDNSIFGKMIVMSILLATVSYTLFGKK